MFDIAPPGSREDFIEKVLSRKTAGRRYRSDNRFCALSAALVAVTFVTAGAVFTLNFGKSGVEGGLEYGNTPGNITSGGITAIKGGWIYYSNDNDGGRLYKMREDGSEKTRLSDRAGGYVSVVGSWVYYGGSEGIGRIRADGSKEELITDDNAPDACLNVVGDRVYYKHADGGLYKIRADGSEKMRLDGEPVSLINVYGDWVYYTVSNGSYIDENKKRRFVYNKKTGEYMANWFYDKGNGIYKIRKDGSEKTKILSGDPFAVNVEGDWIYYTIEVENNLSNLFKIRTDGTGNTQLSDDNIYRFNVDGDWIYFQNYRDGDNAYLYKISTDGSEVRYLFDDFNFKNITVLGDWIYFQVNNFSDNTPLYKISAADGTGLKVMN
jgi:hypothetical protein